MENKESKKDNKSYSTDFIKEVKEALDTKQLKEALGKVLKTIKEM